MDIKDINGKLKIRSLNLFNMKRQDPFIRSWYMLENRLWNRSD